MTAAVGARLARALAAKDGAGLRSLLAGRIDFGGLTPSRHWTADSPGQVVDEIFLTCWFGPDDHIEELCSVSSTGCVGDREHVAYRLRVRNADGEFLIEQQAYYTATADKIHWLRMLCSGFRPVTPEGHAP